MLRPAAAAPGIRLGFDTYSLRAWKWKAPQFIDYAASLKLDTIQLSSLDDYESFEPEYLRGIRERATRARLTLDGGMGCICPTSKSWSPKNGTPAEFLTRGLRTSHAIGATCMRVYMGSSEDRKGPLPLERHMEETVKALRSVRSLALELGVKIAIENHNGDMTARETLQVIQGAGADFVASCLDSGNPMLVMEDPLTTLEVLGPYTVTTHIRDSVVFEHPRGAAWQWVALGDGVVDFKKFVARFRELCPTATMQLENITGRPPRVLPYYENDWWKMFSHMPAADFAAFVALAKRGHPLMEPMVMEDVAGPQPPEFTEALKQQQRRDLERGFEYAKRVLDAGVNWRPA